jgi:ATP-dependent DNA ligase I
MGTTDDKEKLLQLQAFCGGITEERAEELLDASNGSLERAVDIFFHQQQQIEASISSDNPPPPLDTKEQVKPVNSPTRSTTTRPRKKVDKNQAKLDSFFQAESSDKSSNPGVDDHVVEDGGASSKVINVDDSEEDEPAIDLNSAPAVNNLKTEDISIDQEIVGFPSTSSLPPNAISSPKREALPSLSPPLKKPRSNMASKSTGLETEPIKHQVSFLRLSECLQQMADTTKRLVKLDVLQALIQDIIEHADESERGYVLTCALQLVLGRRSSIDHAPMEVSGSAVSKALQTMLGVSRAQLSKGYRATGDLGDSAASLFQKKTFFVTKIRPLSIVQLYESLEKIVTAEGRDSKQHILLQLLRKCQTKSELRFQVRLLIGNMRIGCNLKTVLAALAMALVPEKDSVSVKKNAVALVQKTHDMCPSLDKIVDALLVGGLEKMKKDCTIQVLTPIAPMLANPAHSLEEADKIMSGENSSSVLEWKYDGVRCQAHWDGTTLKLFSRHMLETTAQYPDAAASFLQALSDDVTITSFILDSEIVGVEGEGDNLRLLPFQDLSRRKKKNDDGKGVQIKVFAFDLMYLNGISYTNRPLWERQQVLYEHFQETSGFSFVSSLTLTRFDEPTIRGFLEEAVRGGAEGLMLKLLGKAATVANVNGDPELAESTHVPSVTTLATCQYEAGTRSQSWLKIKRDYVAGYADTIDVVPIGAW